MAYTAPTTVSPGDPVTGTGYNILVNDIIDHETRILALESGASKIYVWNDYVLNTFPSSSITGIDYWRAPISFTLTTAKIVIADKGSLTGTIEIDVHLQSTMDTSGSSSVFSTKPSLDLTVAASYSESSNAVFSTTSIAAGQFLRLDISSLPSSGVMGRFYVVVFGEV